MKKTNKKRTGFTIVELVIVIGVIGILAAILIPTFVNLTGKAKDTSTKSFVSEINKQLAINDAMDDDNVEKHHFHNLHDVKNFLADEKGFDISKITPSDGSELIWDEDNNKFALVSTSGEVTFADFDITPLAHKKWIVAKSGSTFLPSARIRRGLSTKDANPFDGYSIYLADNSYSGDITVSAGFDAGDNDNIDTVTYQTNDDKDVIIRTASAKTTVNVDAQNGSVDYYGSVGTLYYNDAENIYLNDVNIPFLEVTKGRFVIGAGATVGQIHLVSEDGETFDDITIAIESGVTIPKISRDEVTINPAGTLVAAIQDGNTKEDANTQYIWLYQQGVMEQIVVTDTDTFDDAQKASEYSGDSNLYKAADYIANGYLDGYNWDNVNKDEEGNILDNVVIESGLDNDEKELDREKLVTDAINQELAEKGESIPLCEPGTHVYGEEVIVKEATCTTAGNGYRECSVCGHKDQFVIEALGHNADNLIGTFCNTCGHPIAFVDDIVDFTAQQPNMDYPELMPVITDILGIGGWNFNGDSFSTFLDCAYQFSAFAEGMHDEYGNPTFDNSKSYSLNQEALAAGKFEFIEDENGMFNASNLFNFFGQWYCDFYVSFDEDVDAYSCGLGGYYSGLSVGFLLPDINGDGVIRGNNEIPLLETMIKAVMGNNAGSNYYWPYSDIANLVKDFKCGFFNLSEFNVGKTFTVNLRMVNPQVIDNHHGLYDQETYSYQLNENVNVELPAFVDVATIEYEIDSLSDANKGLINDTFANQEKAYQLLNECPELSRLFGEMLPAENLFNFLAEESNNQFILFCADYLDEENETHRYLVSSFINGLLTQINENELSDEFIKELISYSPYIKDCLRFLDEETINNVFAAINELCGDHPELSRIIGFMLNTGDLLNWLSDENNLFFTLFCTQYLDSNNADHCALVNTFANAFLYNFVTNTPQEELESELMSFMAAYEDYFRNALEFLSQEQLAVLVGQYPFLEGILANN